MIERRKRGMVRTGTAALGAALMAIALAASPVGATPFEGEDTGQFWAVSQHGFTFERGWHSRLGNLLLTSGSNTLAGAEPVQFVSLNDSPETCTIGHLRPR